MEFDISRYVLIFLTYFGHNLGTALSSIDSSRGDAKEKLDFFVSPV
jgi:hypothetical protein